MAYHMGTIAKSLAILMLYLSSFPVRAEPANHLFEPASFAAPSQQGLHHFTVDVDCKQRVPKLLWKLGRNSDRMNTVLADVRRQSRASAVSSPLVRVSIMEVYPQYRFFLFLSVAILTQTIFARRPCASLDTDLCQYEQWLRGTVVYSDEQHTFGEQFCGTFYVRCV